MKALLDACIILVRVAGVSLRVPGVRPQSRGLEARPQPPESEHGLEDSLGEQSGTHY
jgi:hypothetical protein